MVVSGKTKQVIYHPYIAKTMFIKDTKNNLDEEYSTKYPGLIKKQKQVGIITENADSRRRPSKVDIPGQIYQALNPIGV